MIPRPGRSDTRGFPVGGRSGRALHSPKKRSHHVSDDQAEQQTGDGCALCGTTSGSCLSANNHGLQPSE